MKLHRWLPLSRVQSSQCPEVPAEIVDTLPVIRAQVIPSHELLHQGTLHSKSLSPHVHSVYTLDADENENKGSCYIGNMKDFVSFLIVFICDSIHLGRECTFGVSFLL
jgi:hypothetical protein